MVTHVLLDAKSISITFRIQGWFSNPLMEMLDGDLADQNVIARLMMCFHRLFEEIEKMWKEISEKGTCHLLSTFKTSGDYMKNIFHHLTHPLFLVLLIFLS